MVDGMEIETHQFGDTDYVLIRVYIGKMPPARAKQYIASLRENTALCKQLDEREIGYDLVGVRDNTSSMSVETKVEKTDQIEKVGRGATEVKAGRGSKIEKLPSGQNLGEELDSLSQFRQNFMRALASSNVKKAEESEPKNGKVKANRNELLKVDNDLKTDSFADAMKLMD